MTSDRADTAPPPPHAPPIAPAAQPSAPPQWWAPARRTHPRATTSMVLGIIGITGVMFVVPFVVSPLAWYFGAVARREAARDEDRWVPSGAATAGVVTGAIGTVLLIGGALIMLAVTVLTWVLNGTETGYGG